ncbi:MAG: CpaF family protein [Microcella sp.]
MQPFVPVDPRGVGSLVDPGAVDPAQAEPGRERCFAPEVLAALGPLAAVAADPAAPDVLVTPDGGVWADRGRGVEREPGLRFPPEAARSLAVGLIAAGGRHVDEATPSADVRLGEGMRAHVVLPPLAWAGTAISLRLPRVDRVTLDAWGLAAPALAALRGALAARHTVLFAGATGSGKTTLMAAWLSEAAPTDRIVLIEDVAEAPVEHPHVVGLECRQPNIEGAGGVDLGRLVREALRMRPDRLVVGECRGAEVREFLAALNTGHRGGAGTLHANSLVDVAARLEAIGLIAGLPPEALARQVLSGIDLVVHLERGPQGARSAALGRFALDARERLVVVPLADPDAGGDAGAGAGAGAQALAELESGSA